MTKDCGKTDTEGGVASRPRKKGPPIFTSGPVFVSAGGGLYFALSAVRNSVHQAMLPPATRIERMT